MQPFVIGRKLSNLSRDRLFCGSCEAARIVEHDPVNHLILALSGLGDLLDVVRIFWRFLGLLAESTDIAPVKHDADFGRHKEGPEGTTPWAGMVLAYEPSGL